MLFRRLQGFCQPEDGQNTLHVNLTPDGVGHNRVLASAPGITIGGVIYVLREAIIHYSSCGCHPNRTSLVNPIFLDISHILNHD